MCSPLRPRYLSFNLPTYNSSPLFSKPHFGHFRSFLFMSAFHNAFEAFLASPDDATGAVVTRPSGGLTVTNPSPEAEIGTTPLRKSTRTRRRKKFESSSSSGGSDSVSTVTTPTATASLSFLFCLRLLYYPLA